MTEPTCVAALRDRFGQLFPGTACGAPARRDVVGAYLCDYHYAHATTWAEQVARVRSEWVYYVQRSDRLIKIGTSRMVVERLETLTREHGPLTLMATHGGGHKEETEIHREFKALRVVGEWFRPELALLMHIKKVHIATGNLQSEDLPKRINRPQLNRMIREAKAMIL